MWRRDSNTPRVQMPKQLDFRRCSEPTKSLHYAIMRCKASVGRYRRKEEYPARVTIHATAPVNSKDYPRGSIAQEHLVHEQRFTGFERRVRRKYFAYSNDCVMPNCLL